MRIVLDTNVLIAAFITQGTCSDVLEHCARRHTLITSEFILNEFSTHLVLKFGYSEEETQEANRLLRSRMEVVTPTPLGFSVCRDPDDDVILGTAIAGQATCIITGDTDLLVIREFRSVDIIRPAEFASYEATKVGED